MNSSRWLPSHYNTDTNLQIQSKLTNAEGMYQLSDFQYRILKNAANSGNGIFVILEPIESDPENLKKNLAEQTQGLKALVQAGIFVDCTDEHGPSVKDKLDINRPFMIVKFAENWKLMFEGPDRKRKVN